MKRKKIKYVAYFIFSIAGFAFASCNNETRSTPAEKKQTANTTVVTETKPVIRYHLDSIANKAQLDSLLHSWDTTDLYNVLSLNRLSPGRIYLHAKIIVPDTMIKDRLAYAPFPEQLVAFDSLPKLIIISERIQAFAAYENGKLVRWGPTSTGRKAKPTPPGLHYTNYKARLKISTVDGSWKMPWYFNIQNRGGIGMHQFTMPGYPASHSCVRMLEMDARWIFYWAEQWQLTKDGTSVIKNGTPVIIFGTYGFGQTPPWKQLQENNEATKITPEEIETINSFLPMIK